MSTAETQQRLRLTLCAASRVIVLVIWALEVPHDGQYLTGKLRDRTYKRVDVKDKILKLTNLH